MAEHDDEEPKRSFKVEDRRRFSETGESRATAPEPAAQEPPPRAEDHGHRHDAPPMEMSFSTFVISLSTQALAQLGEIADPMQGRIAVDLIAAKQLIDILGILEAKTKGNLDEGEAALLDGCLYDLRLKYVEVVRRQGTPAARS
jgi:hypothetical protein